MPASMSGEIGSMQVQWPNEEEWVALEALFRQWFEFGRRDEFGHADPERLPYQRADFEAYLRALEAGEEDCLPFDHRKPHPVTTGRFFVDWLSRQRQA